MAAYVFPVSFFLMLLAAVSSWLLAIPTLSALRRAHPEQHRAAGSPSPWTWSLIEFSLLRYLVKGRFRAVPDRRLVWGLKALRLLWLWCFFCMAVMFGTLVAGLGA